MEADYPELVTQSLKNYFPDFEKHVPAFRWKWINDRLKLFFVCKHRLNISKFFFEIIHRWLIPGKRLDTASLFSSDFRFNNSLYTLSEMTLRMDPSFPRDQVEHNLKVIETELRLGMISVYHASRLLETHFTSPEQKNSQIQEQITKLLQRNPDEIDYDIFGQLQQFMVMSRDEFKIHRSAHHLSRIVTACYLFTQSIESATSLLPKGRHVRMKLSNVSLDLPWGPKEVLGVCVGLNFLHREEIFEERHLFRALQSGMQGIQPVADSFYSHEDPSKNRVVLYLEIEKENNEPFTPQELKTLRHFLPGEITKSIEVPLKSVFMPRNEEEILKYIVTLSGQLRFVKDLPQAILMFDEQKGGELYFTVIIVRILFPTSYSIQYLFGQAETTLSFMPDRIKRVGLLRKRYPKEATVFRVHFSSQPFLREDQTVDLFRARQWVFEELEKVMGPLRDYTGGLLAKQAQLIDQVEELLEEKDPLLETFFHALYPVEARSFLSPEIVKNGFLLWKQLLEFPEDPFKIERDPFAVYAMGHSSVMPELDPSDFGENELVMVRPQDEYVGYFFVSADIEQQQAFISRVMELKRANVLDQKRYEKA